MSKERPFEDITPVSNIKVGYFEKEEYLKIIDRQAKQIDNFAYTVTALQTRIELLEKRQKRPQGDFTIDELKKWLYEIVFNNYYNDFGRNCLEIINRLDGFERFVADMREKEANDE